MPKAIPTTRKYFLYCRKSSEAEDCQILSIDSQVIELKRFAEQQGIQILEVLTEAKSAKAPGVRPIFNSMMTRLYQGEAEGVLCWKLDRLARNPVDGGSIIWALKQHGLTIVTPVQTFSQAEDNVVWMYLEFGMAQKYVDDLSRNVKRGLKTKAEMGWFPGRTPLGYLNRTHPNGHKTIARDPKRFPIVRKCWELMLTEKYTPANVWEIANNVLGFKSVRGKPMSRSTIYNIFTSPFYVGRYEYPKASGIWHTGRHIPMVTETEYAEVQRLMARGYKWPMNRKTFALTGLIRCGNCDRAITAEEKHQLICSICHFKFAYRGKVQCPWCKTAIRAMKNPKKLLYTYYHCSGHGKNGGCDEPSIELRRLLGQLVDVMGQISLPVPYEQWMKGQVKTGRATWKNNVLGAIRESFTDSTPEQQRLIVTAMMDNLRLKDRTLSLDLKMPFNFTHQFQSSAALPEQTFVQETNEQQKS